MYIFNLHNVNIYKYSSNYPGFDYILKILLYILSLTIRKKCSYLGHIFDQLIKFITSRFPIDVCSTQSCKNFQIPIIWG